MLCLIFSFHLKLFCFHFHIKLSVFQGGSLAARRLRILFYITAYRTLIWTRTTYVLCARKTSRPGHWQGGNSSKTAVLSRNVIPFSKFVFSFSPIFQVAVFLFVRRIQSEEATRGGGDGTLMRVATIRHSTWINDVLRALRSIGCVARAWLSQSMASWSIKSTEIMIFNMPCDVVTFHLVG